MPPIPTISHQAPDGELLLNHIPRTHPDHDDAAEEAHRANSRVVDRASANRRNPFTQVFGTVLLNDLLFMLFTAECLDNQDAKQVLLQFPVKLPHPVPEAPKDLSHPRIKEPDKPAHRGHRNQRKQAHLPLEPHEDYGHTDEL